MKDLFKWVVERFGALKEQIIIFHFELLFILI